MYEAMGILEALEALGGGACGILSVIMTGPVGRGGILVRADAGNEGELAIVVARMDLCRALEASRWKGWLRYRWFSSFWSP